ncbi:MAG: ATP-binding protein, partial [Planctomycetota bacterium]
VARAVTGIRPLADSQGLRIEPNISPVIEAIEADGNRLMRVLENLLRNAIRHARSRVVVSVEPTVPGGDAVFTVSDDGPGFPLRDGEPVLTRQPGESDSRDADSAGLGLTIARRIVESHAGTLSIENAPDSGAVVRFRIPAGPNAHEPQIEERSSRRDERAS